MKRFGVETAREHFKNKPITAIEIGVYKAEHAKYMLDNLNITTLYLVDPYEVYDDPSSKMGKDKEFPLIEKEARKTLRGYGKRIKWVKQYSGDALDVLPEVDFIYIDGNHDYPYVIEDMRNYWLKVRGGGILSGHDITHKKGVRKAFNEFTKEIGKSGLTSKTDWLIWKS